jgi:hypothetical protein
MSGYSAKAQPYLNAIADSVFTSQEVRDWLIKATPMEANYLGSDILIEEQEAVRWAKRQTKQPYWANYFCGLDSRCTCRIEGSKSLESDAIFFFRKRRPVGDSSRVLAVHVEFKHPREPFKLGQAEGYPLRAACFVKTQHERITLNEHHDWTTVIFCGAESLRYQRRLLDNFQRVITHDEAAVMIGGYPTDWQLSRRFSANASPPRY